MEMKETFNRLKVHKEIVDFQIGELVWFNIQRQIFDMKYNKAKWVGPCKIVSISKKGFLSWHTRLTRRLLSMNVYTLNF